jgi:hypothetical protein
MSKQVIIIIVMASLLLVTAHALVRTENQRYALFAGMCTDPIRPKTPCLEKVETRTGWWWHLYYALQN